MTTFFNSFRIKTAVLVVAGLLAGQEAFAGDFARALHNFSGNQGGSHSNSSGNKQFKSQFLNSKQEKKEQSKVIAAPNGNTGISGVGLPQSSGKSGKQYVAGQFPWLNHLNSKKSDSKVIAAPNGNTGITGTGLPQSGLNASGMSKKGGSHKKGTLMQNLTQGKNGANQQGPSKADLDAQAEAEKLYIAAQNAASVERGQLGGLQAKYVQASDKYSQAVGVEAQNRAAEDLKGAGLRLSEESLRNNIAVANVNAATFNKNAADAKVQAAIASNNSGGGNGKSSGGGMLPTNHFPFPSGQVIHYRNSSVRNSGYVTTMDVPMSAPVVQAAAPADASTLDTAAAVATSADLVLEDIQLASPATLVAGPAYTVKFRNQGSDAASSFQVGVLVGVDGKITADAPRGVVEVKSLAAGQSAEVTLRLPQSALRIIGTDGQSTPFTHLAVAIDLMSTVAETDESNNAAVVERSGLGATAAN